MQDNIILLNQIPSTQTYLLNALNEREFDDYSVVASFNQTQGKGQATHKWESEKNKNISFSIVLKDKNILAQNQFQITQIISLAIVDMIKKYIKQEVYIKWPNDIYVKQNKICGFLTQNKIIGNTIDVSVCGIGINVNQKHFVFAPNPTSLCLETNKEYELNSILNETISCIKQRFNILNEKEIERMQSEYLSLLLYRNIWKKYLYQNKEIEGKIVGVNSYGHLVFKTKDDKQHLANLTEITFLHQ